MVDKPVLQYIVEEAVAAGIEDILIITNRGKGAMDDYFDYAPELERRLEASGKTAELAAVRRPAELANLYFIRQKETKGLGHAIGQARRFVGDEPFAILLGDDIMRAERPVIGQLIEAAEAYDASVIGVQQVPDEMVSKYGVIKAQPLGNKVFTVTDMQEKPALTEKFSKYAVLGRRYLTFWTIRPPAWAGRSSSPTPSRPSAARTRCWRWILRGGGTTRATSGAFWRPPSTSPWTTRRRESG